MALKPNRRTIIKASAAAGFGVWVAGRGAWAQDGAVSKSPNERLSIACIGVGGKGASDSTHVGMYADVVAMVDIDDNTLAKKAKEFPKAQKFNDYRKMFDALGKSIDAVTVTIPDHHHAVAALMAVKAGKHVYCQKPMTRTIQEARMLREAAREYKVCTQMGNQGTAGPELRRGVEVLRGGVLGPVTEVHIWTNRPIWPQAPLVTKAWPAEPIPASVHWDEWIGPAPMRPYSNKKQDNGHGPYHDFNWRGWWDFGTGALGDMGCHTANMPFMGLELGHPSSVEAKCGDLNDQTYPSWATVIFQFPARGDKPPVKVTWWEGHRPDSRDAAKRNLPDTSITKGFEMPNSGSLCIGSKGMMFSLHDYGWNDQIVFNAGTEGFTVTAPKVLPEVPRTASQIAGRRYDNDEGQKAEWFAAIKANKHEVALSNFDYAGMLTEFILLGNAAIRAGKRLEWDGPGLKFTNNEEANQLLTREYRDGWKPV